jgi:hypothetical protein
MANGAMFSTQLIKPILCANAQLLFSAAGKGLARLDNGDNTTWYPSPNMASKLFCISALSSSLISFFIFSLSIDVSVLVLFLFLFLYMEAC